MTWRANGAMKDDEVRRSGWHTPPGLWERLKPIARQMRRAPTPAEDHLWQRLRDRQLRGHKFRRQHAIERFIVDFHCAEARLVVEVDGPVHQYTCEEDAIRQDFLASRGFRVLRLSNEMVATDIESALARIADACACATPASSPSPQAERGPGGEVHQVAP